ncbi:hypothetical protein [Hymenobacter cellulosivorans]|uniref:Lipoprotein n=1 Tax=Hymenobacter cellulosivorans TaxID=2932249 RepID=A0ABY4FED9_9BACT|nr:hypothetical protein [Hymenobacter cellulosivorans]UOQ55042.1 hypothetical protein MUN80_09855 [Hymenobacter cellulosivorans]
MQYTFPLGLVVLLSACETPLTRQGASGAQSNAVETGAHSLVQKRSDRLSVGRYDPASGRFYTTTTLQHDYILQIEYEDEICIIDPLTEESVLCDTIQYLVAQDDAYWLKRYTSNASCPRNPWLAATQPLAYAWDNRQNKVLMWVTAEANKPPKRAQTSTYAAVCFYLVD